jgi:hypothetical protein
MVITNGLALDEEALIRQPPNDGGGCAAKRRIKRYDAVYVFRRVWFAEPSDAYGCYR